MPGKLHDINATTYVRLCVYKDTFKHNSCLPFVIYFFLFDS